MKRKEIKRNRTTQLSRFPFLSSSSSFLFLLEKITEGCDAMAQVEAKERYKISMNALAPLSVPVNDSRLMRNRMKTTVRPTGKGRAFKLDKFHE
jgi:hypothetical protein